MPDATKVHVYDDGALKGSFNVDGSGNWSGSITGVAAGASSITAKAEDAAGNVSSQTAKKVYTGSTTTPTCDLLDDSGQSSTDNITNDNTPRIKVYLDLSSENTAMGVAVAANSVSQINLEHSADGGNTWTKIGSTGSPEYSNGKLFTYIHQITSALADGSHKFRANWEDAMNNASAFGSVLTITIDTAAPNAPTVTDPADGQVFIGTTLTVSGTAQ